MFRRSFVLGQVLDQIPMHGNHNIILSFSYFCRTELAMDMFHCSSAPAQVLDKGVAASLLPGLPRLYRSEGFPSSSSVSEQVLDQGVAASLLLGLLCLHRSERFSSNCTLLLFRAFRAGVTIAALPTSVALRAFREL